MENRQENNFQSPKYSLFAKSLHWALAILIIGMLCLGWYMMAVADRPDSEKYFDLHKSFGLVAASLILMRVIWRSKHRPRSEPSMPQWQERVARTSHLLLYGLMIAMPLTGFFGTEFSQWGMVFFGKHLPTFQQNKAISEPLYAIHSYLAWALVGLISLHILAALSHLLWKKDDIFRQMWFSKKHALHKKVKS